MESPDWLEGLLNKASVQVPKEAKTLSLLKARESAAVSNCRGPLQKQWKFFQLFAET